MSRRAVVLDGVLYETTISAARAIGGRVDSMRINLSMGRTTYLGHTIAYADEVDHIVAGWRPRRHTPGTPLLLSGLVTHRLGAWVGGCRG